MIVLIYSQKTNLFGDTGDNGQSFVFNYKTVDYINNRYRLGHLWVLETVLNVQSYSVFFFLQ